MCLKPQFALWLVYKNVSLMVFKTNDPNSMHHSTNNVHCSINALNGFWNLKPHKKTMRTILQFAHAVLMMHQKASEALWEWSMLFGEGHKQPWEEGLIQPTATEDQVGQSSLSAMGGRWWRSAVHCRGGWGFAAVTLGIKCNLFVAAVTLVAESMEARTLSILIDY